jgi:hypothetical protein
MRLALTALLLALPALAVAGVPVLLSERQAVTLEFTQPVQRLAVSDPEALGLKPSGSAVRVQGRRAGRFQLDVVFADGATASFDVTVEALRRAAVRPPAPDEIELAAGEERAVPAPAGSQVLLEDNGVARAVQDGRGVVVRGMTPGSASMVVVEPSGARTTWKLRVR